MRDRHCASKSPFHFIRLQRTGPVGTMGRGKLRIYPGAAPGVGKTYVMLSEAHRRTERGTDCVVAFVEHHDRPRAEVMLHGLDQVQRRAMRYRSGAFTEMRADAVLERRPSVARVDKPAHTDVPGWRNAKRRQDVEELPEAGVNVSSTADIQHLESLGDVVESMTGARQRETVPDEVVRRADQIGLVDMSPRALRRRMAHGNIYKPDKLDAALSNYFRPGNLTALREPALLRVADRVDEYLQHYRGEHGIRTTWQAGPRTHRRRTHRRPRGRHAHPPGRAARREGSRRRSARGVHHQKRRCLTSASPRGLAVQRTVVENVGGTTTGRPADSSFGHHFRVVSCPRRSTDTVLRNGSRRLPDVGTGDRYGLLKGVGKLSGPRPGGCRPPRPWAVRRFPGSCSHDACPAQALWSIAVGRPVA